MTAFSSPSLSPDLSPVSGAGTILSSSASPFPTLFPRASSSPDCAAWAGTLPTSIGAVNDGTGDAGGPHLSGSGADEFNRGGVLLREDDSDSGTTLSGLSNGVRPLAVACNGGAGIDVDPRVREGRVGALDVVVGGEEAAVTEAVLSTADPSALLQTHPPLIPWLCSPS